MAVPRGWLLAALGAVLAFGFLGARGIWDPDEGRYTNVALTMLDNADWLTPMRSEDVGHWTKPPLTYWLLASSIATFGSNPWAARLPIALSYLACIVLAWLCARRLAPGSESAAALVYMTMLLPVGAAQLVTTDYPLAATQALAMCAFVEYRFGEARRRGALILVMWVAFAIAFLVKGPPALLPLPAIAALRVLVPPPWRVAPGWHLAGVMLFVLVAAPWFVYVTARHPGLLQYFLASEVVERVASDRFQRHGEWYGWAAIYVPTLLVGTMPWTAAWWRWVRALPQRARAWRDPDLRSAWAGQLFLALWIALPLLVFCGARSRLPLYLLPLFLPIAVAIAAQRTQEGRSWPATPRVAVWVVALLGLRLAGAAMSTHKDASGWADAIRERAQGPVSRVLFVDDMARYGLHLHLGAEVEKISRRPLSRRKAFNPEYDEPLDRELAETGALHDVVYVAKSDVWPVLRRQIENAGYESRALGEPYFGRVIFRVAPRRNHAATAVGAVPKPAEEAGPRDRRRAIADSARSTQRLRAVMPAAG
jgi:4-amino-4-deoxy-L-arabinose transferase-like glycosyltransferase